LTTTGHPAATALAVSPPRTEKANGKLDAEKTATTPSGTRSRRRSGLGAGMADGSRVSIAASHKAPSTTASANAVSWYAVRASSARSRGSVRPVSDAARAMASSACARSAADRACSTFDRAASVESKGMDCAARRHARSTSVAPESATGMPAVSSAVIAGRPEPRGPLHPDAIAHPRARLDRGCRVRRVPGALVPRRGQRRCPRDGSRRDRSTARSAARS
jgi:hypothetical protein